MIVVEPLPVRQARTRARRTRWVTAFLVVASVLALSGSVWTALHLSGPLWTGGLAGLALVAGFWAGGRCIGKVDDPT